MLSLRRGSAPPEIGNMVAMKQIEESGRRIGREFGTDRVILSGSHARGEVTTDSDVDILAIRPFEGRSVDRSVEIRMQLRPAFPGKDVFFTLDDGPDEYGCHRS